jgi:hypothetical protein
MASETTTGATQGAAQGAAAGAAVGGPWGAIIGAVIGGVTGYFGGKKQKLAKKYARLAQEQRRKQQQMQLAVQRRDIIRQFRMQRAQAVAAGASDAGVGSSSVAGAVSSVYSQGLGAVNYFDSQVGLDNMYQLYAKKSGKAAQQADQIFGFLNSATSFASVGGDLYGASKGSGTSTVSASTLGAETGGYTSFSGAKAGSSFTSYGSSLVLG